MRGQINCIPKALQADICTSPNFDLHAAQLVALLPAWQYTLPQTCCI